MTSSEQSSDGVSETETASTDEKAVSSNVYSSIQYAKYWDTVFTKYNMKYIFVSFNTDVVTRVEYGEKGNLLIYKCI